ncbi:hypothetical protein [Ammoniphilus sp. YIM 78166]|uniref:hypothetical protein n=1 Tax=Ammoniphilus sp. YIM 78166 TaxID=1644106 RepID=UPI00106F8F48|nr:hypothetical protein [Ammoniphilus sp. YIM 78166]
MKKNLLLSGIAALAILGLVGCNSQEPVQGEPPTTEQEQKVEGNQEQPAEEKPAEEQPAEKKE